MEMPPKKRPKEGGGFLLSRHIVSSKFLHVKIVYRSTFDLPKKNGFLSNQFTKPVPGA